MSIEQSFVPKQGDSVIPPGKEKVARELVQFGKDNGNNLSFKDYGEVFLEGEEVKIKQELLEGLDQAQIEDFQNRVKFLKSYISGPIFTDDFEIHKNYDDLRDLKSRVGWENSNLEKLTPEAKKYYEENRLNVGSRITPAIGCLDLITYSFGNQKIEDELSKIRENLPEELVENGGEGYFFASKEKKVEIVQRFSDLIKAAVSFLEEKGK